ncbi:MAG: tyrosinase family protein [Bacteroidota bacterium]
MEIEFTINQSSSEAAAYIGWAPVECRISADIIPGEEVTLELRNKSAEQGGKVVFLTAASKHVPRTSELTLALNQEGWARFYIAGHFPFASTNDKDTHIEVYRQGETTPVFTKPLMVRVRKNANQLTEGERNRLVVAFDKIRRHKPRNQYDNPTQPGARKPQGLLDELVLMHSEDSAREIHNRGSFHCWHRIFLLHVERELQAVDPSVTLPFWKFDEKAENVFSRAFIGETAFKAWEPNTDPTEYKVEVKFAPNHPWGQHRWQTVWGPLYRNYLYKDHNPAETPMYQCQDESIVLTRSDRFIEWRDFEEYRSHNPAHGGMGGLVSDIGKDPADPLFHLLHTNVDRLWAKWQKMHQRFNPNDENAYPFKRDYRYDFEYERNSLARFNLKNFQVGNFLHDTLWPWDWDYNLPRPNHAHAVKGTGHVRVQPNIYLRLPESPVVKGPGLSPTVYHAIDYHGEHDPAANLGFDYIDVPYFEELAAPAGLTNQEALKEQAGLLAIGFDTARPVEERKAALQGVRWLTDDYRQLARDLVKDINESEALRTVAMNLMPLQAEEELDDLLEVASNPNEPAGLRANAIQHLRRSKRSSEFFVSRQPAFFELLRGMVAEEDAGLRMDAVEILASNGDEFVQRMLLNELQSDAPANIPKEQAVFFLSMDFHADHAPVLRKLLQEDSSSTIRAAAAIGLANDFDAQPLLKELVFNNEEAPEVRMASLNALHIQDAEQAVEAAVDMMASDETPAAPLQAQLMNVVLHSAEPEKLKQHANFMASLESLPAEPEADLLAEASDEEAAALKQMTAEIRSMTGLS